MSAARALPKVRLTLEFPERTNEQLEELVERTNSSSKTEVLRKALALLEVAVTAQEEGKKVGVAEKDQPLTTEFVGLR